MPYLRFKIGQMKWESLTCATRWPPTSVPGRCMPRKRKPGPDDRGDEMRPETVADIRRALEKAGITIIEENGGGPGVRLAKRRKR